MDAAESLRQRVHQEQQQTARLRAAAVRIADAQQWSWQILVPRPLTKIAVHVSVVA